MKGTNTFFASDKAAHDKERAPANVSSASNTTESTQVPKPTLPKLTFGPFNKPGGKSRFQAKFVECLKAQYQDLPKTVQDQRPEDFGKLFADQLDTMLRDRQHGFLPDNARWNLLYELLEHGRFGLAIAAGHLTAMFIIESEEKFLRDHVHGLNKIAEDVFKSRMRSRGLHQGTEVRPAQQEQTPTHEHRNEEALELIIS